MERTLTSAAVVAYRHHLLLEEKSSLTIEKYLRDIRAFGSYAGNRTVTKALVLTYKSELQARYAARSINSILAKHNSRHTNFFFF